MIILISIVVGVLILFRINVVRNFFDELFLNQKFMTYSCINNSPESKSYKIEKILKGQIGFVMYDEINENCIIQTDLQSSSTHLLWKVNNKGIVIDSIKSKSDLYRSGVYFYENYCIDWVISGNKAPKMYDSIINYDTLTKDDFEALLNKGEVVYFTKEYGHKDYYDDTRSIPEKGRCFINIQQKWLVIESKKMFDELDLNYSYRDYEVKHNKYKKKVGRRLTPITSYYPLSTEWDNKNSNFCKEEFVREYYHHARLFNFQDISVSGWEGTGFFRLKYKSEEISFKAPARINTSFFWVYI